MEELLYAENNCKWVDKGEERERLKIGQQEEVKTRGTVSFLELYTCFVQELFRTVILSKLVV